MPDMTVTDERVKTAKEYLANEKTAPAVALEIDATFTGDQLRFLRQEICAQALLDGRFGVRALEIEIALDILRGA